MNAGRELLKLCEMECHFASRTDFKRDKKVILSFEEEIDFCCSGDTNQRGLVRIFGSGLAVLPRGIANFLCLRTDTDLGSDLAGVHVELWKPY
ncbi:hypothetical protein AVEN_229590-1 [Araneus ventricosus]|uniref:Uncharacterized protein n=1 Tax=Araneus ventricosus TaxID=182803 RepID=A0A4Y2DA88_ARAVE|nr:hypothetical protein AVEN_229590-1 [Araneus ventricosus]